MSDTRQIPRSDRGPTIAVQRTALIPAAARALASGRPAAWWALARRPPGARPGLGVWPVAVDPLVQLNVGWRTGVLHAAARDFFAAHPAGLGVNLGCGLADPFRRLDNHRNRWIDADLPSMLKTRRALVPTDCDRQHAHPVDLRQPGWWQALGLPARGRRRVTPVFVLCEGVMMYLEPPVAQAVLREFAAHAPRGSRWAMDLISWLGVGCAALLPSLAATGAQFLWGVQHLDELAALHPRLHLRDVHSVAECWGPAGLWGQALGWPWLGAPPYSVVTLGVSGG